jgi:type I restriction enzyme, R subunit
MKPNQIKNVVRAFKDSLPEMFPGRTNVCKTIIFAKHDDAGEIIKAVRSSFAEGNDFIQKIAYRATEAPKTKIILANFCNLFNPRIVVVTIE